MVLPPIGLTYNPSLPKLSPLLLLPNPDNIPSYPQFLSQKLLYVPSSPDILLFFLEDMQQSPYGRGIFIIEIRQGLLCIIEVATRLPGVLLMSVILPLDEVLVRIQ